MTRQRFLLYRDLCDKEPHFRQMAPVSLCVHVGILLLALLLNYALNGVVWSIGGSTAGGGNPEITLIQESIGGLTPPPVSKAEPPKPETEPEEKTETPKPKPEPPKEKPKEVEQPKAPDPEAVQVPTTPKKDPPKKEEPKKPDPPKEKPKEVKKEEKKEPPKPKPKPVTPDKPKDTPKVAKTPPPTRTSSPTMLAKNDGAKTGPQPLLGGGPTGEGVGAPGPGGTSSLPSELQGWGTSLYMKIHPIWSMNQPGGLRRDPDNYAEITFTVNRDGNILGEPKITKHAIDPEIDEIGMKALKLAGRLPSFPTNISLQSITVCYRYVPPQ